jgi:hypothetical protein
VLSFKRILDRIRESDVRIYTAAINTATGVFGKGSNDRGQLEQLAETTGGYAHFGFSRLHVPTFESSRTTIHTPSNANAMSAPTMKWTVTADVSAIQSR